MIRVKTLVIFSLLIGTQMVWTTTAEAGPLMDWIRTRRAARQAATAPMAAPAANPACGTCTTTCTQTCQRVVVNYVPCTAYRASWERVPVTTYQQTTSTDPCTGCTVTCNRPCTSYSWRMKQVPFTTYRPVYRTETYQVPVTYTTPAPAQVAAPCNTCPQPPMQSMQAYPAMPQSAPGGCSTCSVPPSMSAPMVQAPSSTLNPGTYYEPNPNNSTLPIIPSPSVPADTVPTLAAPQAMQRPMVEGTANPAGWPSQFPNQSTQYHPIQDPYPQARWNNEPAPQYSSSTSQTANTPAVERWNYSAVKLASYESPLSVPVALQEQPEMEPREYVGTLSVSPQASPAEGQRVNEGWRHD